MPSKRRPTSDGRIPMTITLSADDYQFIRNCVRANDRQSVDELIAAALAAFREHLLAFMEWPDNGARSTSGLRCSVTYRWTL